MGTHYLLSKYSQSETLTAFPRLDFPTQRGRRGQVKDQAGYNSDSSNEDIDYNSRKRAGNADDDEGDDDMFGGGGAATKPDLEAKDNDTRVKDRGLELQGDAAKGGKEFLDLGDITGQEFNTAESSATGATKEAYAQKLRVTEEDIDYVEGEEYANDDDAVIPKERKSADGMGFAISGFNMAEEMREGKFSADGSEWPGKAM